MARSKKTSAKRSGSAPRPEGELRQSQMITTYGPGALVDLVDDAILVPGLDYWSYVGASGYELQEDRLATNLRRRLLSTGVSLSTIAPFRAPPVSASDDQHQGCGVKAIEFPSWFLCPAKGCESLIHKKFTELKGGRRTHRCMSSKNTKLVPVRFVTACSNGHLDDFPWDWFVHKGREGGRCDAPELRLVDRGSGDLSDVIVRCETCDATRSMAQARGEQGLPTCRGLRPWLGAYPEDPSVRENDCNERQRLLLRTASNGYFSQVESALTIPKTSRLKEPVLEFFERYYGTTLALVNSLEALTMLRSMSPVLVEAPSVITALTDAQLWKAVEDYRTELQSDDANEHVRETEYKSILNAETEVGDHRYSSADLEKDRLFTASRPAPGSCPLPPGVRDLVLLKRLRELRVLTGFTRLESPSQNIYGEFDLDSRVAAVSATCDWLPASEIRGEGFFIELDLDRLRTWEAQPAVREREEELRRGFLSRFPPKDDGPDFQGIRFYLLHTLSHLLITQVALECGYAASAIRERLYCSPPGAPEDQSMAGILLSTGSAGSEGTLGGLVEQGRRVAHHLRRALSQAKLCSHDPVCARQHPTGGNPGRALLGAACHGCLFIAECSCERSNQYLDRALVVPTVTTADLAFFNADEISVLDFATQPEPEVVLRSPVTQTRTAAAPAPSGATVDLEDFDEPWHPIITELLETPGVTIEPGGDVAKSKRVIGSYVMLLRRGTVEVHVIDGRAPTAAKCVAALSLQRKGAIPFSPGSDDVAELLSTLE